MERRIFLNKDNKVSYHILSILSIICKISTNFKKLFNLLSANVEHTPYDVDVTCKAVAHRTGKII